YFRLIPLYIILVISVLALNTAECWAKQFTLVIDAGHGGKDKGALGKSSYEKDINLGVALELGKLVKKSINDVKVVYTRDNDTFITLQERANIANKANGDLFISIHTNSIAKKAKGRLTINGASTYTLGLHRSEENLEVAKTENSVIELEPDYTVSYKGFDPNSSESYIIFEIAQQQYMEHSVAFASLVQSELSTTASRTDKGVRQAGFWVLAATSMPAVLVELDYICNPTQEKYLKSEKGQKQLAKAIFNAVAKYKAQNDQRVALASSDNSNAKQKDDSKEKKQKTVQQDEQSHKPEENGQSAADADNNANAILKSIVEENSEFNPELSIRNKKNNKTKKDASKSDKKSRSAKSNKQLDKSAQNTDNSNATKSVNPETIYYRVQFLTSPTILKESDKRLKGIDNVSYYKQGGLYKYTIGNTPDQEEAQRILRKIKGIYKDAFIIKFKDNKRFN
ncbi:MAG: N-acetylmuramoyl-L-alanine amidase, partial [Muribaculaceae bacterium]